MTGQEIYFAMHLNSGNPVIDRAMALHKMMRLATAATGQFGYLNFMGNEFGHPEWIDFPREGNGWSYFYCRRQWHLADDPALRYGELCDFDEQMIKLIKDSGMLKKDVRCLFIDNQKKVLVYERGGVVFALNFSTDGYYVDYDLTVPTRGKYKVCLSSDRREFGGWGRVDENYVYTAKVRPDKSVGFPIYLPARVAVCLQKVK
jgi:1,4-alpha-glucan branching enzyme